MPRQSWSLWIRHSFLLSLFMTRASCQQSVTPQAYTAPADCPPTDFFNAGNLSCASCGSNSAQQQTQSGMSVLRVHLSTPVCRLVCTLASWVARPQVSLSGWRLSSQGTCRSVKTEMLAAATLGPVESKDQPLSVSVCYLTSDEPRVENWDWIAVVSRYSSAPNCA